MAWVACLPDGDILSAHRGAIHDLVFGQRLALIPGRRSCAGLLSPPDLYLHVLQLYPHLQAPHRLSVLLYQASASLVLSGLLLLYQVREPQLGALLSTPGRSAACALDLPADRRMRRCNWLTAQGMAWHGSALCRQCGSAVSELTKRK